jgi:hypothetical protein
LAARRAHLPRLDGVDGFQILGCLELYVAQESIEQGLRVPENCQASMAPIVLTISSASSRRGPFARMEPAFQLPQELIDTAGQTNKLLIIARTMKVFHLLAEYTSAVRLDVSKPSPCACACMTVSVARCRIHDQHQVDRQY